MQTMSKYLTMLAAMERQGAESVDLIAKVLQPSGFEFLATDHSRPGIEVVGLSSSLSPIGPYTRAFSFTSR